MTAWQDLTPKNKNLLKSNFKFLKLLLNDLNFILIVLNDYYNELSKLRDSQTAFRPNLENYPDKFRLSIRNLQTFVNYLDITLNPEDSFSSLHQYYPDLIPILNNLKIKRKGVLSE